MHEEHVHEYEHSTEKKTKQIAGIVIVGFGVMMLADQFLQWINRGTIWALAIIVLGVYLVVTPNRR